MTTPYRFATLLALMLWAGSALAQADLSSARLVTLRNGLRVLLAPDTTAAAVDVTLWSDAGTRTEPAGRSGITLVTERLLIRRAGPQRLWRELEARGGATASFTTPDVTGLSLTVPPDGLAEALALQAARLADLEPTAAGIAEEREALRAERPRRPESSPNGQGMRRLFALLAPDGPYAAPVAGRDEDLARITPRDCLDYFRAHFGPAGALLTIVGRFDPVEATRLMGGTVERLARHGAASPAPAPRAAAAPAPARTSERTDFEVPLVFAGWRAPAAASPDAAVLDVLSRLLTAGISSRLTRALVTPDLGGLLVVGGYDARREGGLLYAAVTVAPDADSAMLEQTLIHETERLAAEPVSAEELERARRQAEYGLLNDWQTSAQRAKALGLAEMAGGQWRRAWDHLEQVRKLTPADVQRVAAAVLNRDHRAVVWMTPRGGALVGGAR